MQQIQQLEMQKQAIELQQNSHNDKDSMQNSFQNNNFNDPSFQQMGNFDQNYNNSNNQYGSESGDNYASNNSISGNENSYDSQIFEQMKAKTEVEEPDLSNLPNVNFSQPPPGFQPDMGLLAFQNGLPDLSKPPPGFLPFPDMNNEDLMPSVPYFELPAGLMVPLIMVCNNILFISIKLGCQNQFKISLKTKYFTRKHYDVISLLFSCKLFEVATFRKKLNMAQIIRLSHLFRTTFSGVPRVSDWGKPGTERAVFLVSPIGLLFYLY